MAITKATIMSITNLITEDADIFNEEGLDDSWTSGETTVTLTKLLDIIKDVPIQNVSTSVLSNLALHGDDPAEQGKIQNADLKYPVLIIVNDDNSINYILDGNHRIQKAVQKKLSEVQAKLIKLSGLPSDFQEVLG